MSQRFPIFLWIIVFHDLIDFFLYFLMRNFHKKAKKFAFKSTMFEVIFVNRKFRGCDVTVWIKLLSCCFAFIRRL